MFVQKKVQTTLTGRPLGKPAATNKGGPAASSLPARPGTTAGTRPFVFRASAKTTAASSTQSRTATSLQRSTSVTFPTFGGSGGHDDLALPKSSLFHSPGTRSPPKPTVTVCRSAIATSAQVGAASGFGAKRKMPASLENAMSPAKRRPTAGTGGNQGATNRSSTFGQGFGSYKAKAPKKPTGPAIPLSDEQQQVLDMVFNERRNVFITGSAGTGKSVVLRAIIARFEELGLTGSESTVSITAPTGIAALNIGGSTIHSFAGIGLGKGSPMELAHRVLKNRRALQRWLHCDVLIVDEVSMLDANLFDTLERIARQLRANAEPFGGIQLILTGDFYQLPPVERERGTTKFCFEASAWQSCIQEVIQLKRVFRQKDMTLVDMLNQIRIGTITPETQDMFRSLARTPSYPSDGIMPTELYARVDDVERANQRRLEQLPGQATTFHAHDTRDLSPETKQRINTACSAAATVVLKLNAQVMLIKNMPEEGLVNGSLGIVTEFRAQESTGLVPVVRFTTGQTLPIEPFTWEFEMDRRIVSRKQIPLRLSWAMSIHKSQGQTIERVLVNLDRIFEKGQAYVALSRATSLNGLQVLGFQATRVMAHPKVIEFYAAMK